MPLMEVADPDRDAWGLAAISLAAAPTADRARMQPFSRDPNFWLQNQSGSMQPPAYRADTRPQEWGYGYVDWRDGIGSDIPDVTTIRWPVTVTPPVVMPAPDYSPDLLLTDAALPEDLQPVLLMPAAWQDSVGTS